VVTDSLRVEVTVLRELEVLGALTGVYSTGADDRVPADGTVTVEREVTERVP
jgi:hypothetical protein